MAKLTFADIVEENFDEIQKNFRAGLKNKGYPYIEDLMHDAFINCNSALQGKEMSKKDAIKYFWTAYINKYKTYLTQNKYECFEDMIEFDQIDDEYNNSTDEIYNIIMKAVQDKFGVKMAYVWELYACHGKSAKEIRNMGFEVDNFVYLNRQVKRYIYNHVIPENNRLRELIRYRNSI